MMSNLFSIFDTNTNNMYGYELNWISSFISLLILPHLFWILPPKMFMLFNYLNKSLNKEIQTILSNKYNKMNKILLSSMFLFIFITNIMGLYPYIFTSSSHMIFSISMSLPLWFSLIIYSLSQNRDFFLSHMIPQGTPIILMPFMVIIESISNIIRPLTLTIRLTANMIAGHLLLTLLSQTASSPFIYLSMSIIIIQILLLILEFSVSIIQSYVFMILSTLYIKETN